MFSTFSADLVELYIARYCLGGEEIASFVSMAVIVPTLIGAAIAVQLCKKYDKFKECKLTPAKAKTVGCPIIEESPLSIECRVKEIVSLGSHHMFIAEVVNVKADNKYIDSETGQMNLAASGLLTYIHGNYYEIGNKIGKFGWSVEKKA